MFTKLTTTEGNSALTIQTEEGEKLHKTMSHLTILRQEEMLEEAKKLRKFAERLGLDGERLATGIQVEGRNRVVTLRFVDDDGLEVGSMNETTGRRFTFGTIYPASVSAKSTNGLQRVLSTITNWSYALGTAKDSLLNLACRKYTGLAVA